MADQLPVVAGMKPDFGLNGQSGSLPRVTAMRKQADVHNLANSRKPFERVIRKHLPNPQRVRSSSWLA